ncbi:hypothetical protein VCSRO155_1589 [Vibrio cholerae]|uniref:DUF2213 domain-containing protein n=1 Tax=Vibrio paracholerae TaxID=650003 RepID=UPI0004E3291C|nr:MULTISPECIES: DUF2213 domain-containing protein [Vibrio]KFD80050.1 hypothetical protein DA89_2601 [Vibrio paracholerae]QAV05662.1 Phage protein [Vibrio cholerae]GHW94859.1 hypothetical protein VCSRO155_1589 [Vibrio cholerae]
MNRHTFDFQSARTYTPEGFLKVSGRAAKTGIQEYFAHELGLTDRPHDAVVRVMRFENEVFSQSALDSYVGADITIEHPDTFVSSETFKNSSVGLVTAAARDGDFVLVDMIVKSQDAIDAIHSGKVELSAGYSCHYEAAPQGASYDFIQRDIAVNHLAITDKARGGSQVRLADSDALVVDTSAKRKYLDSNQWRVATGEMTRYELGEKADALFNPRARSMQTVDAQGKQKFIDANRWKLTTGEMTMNDLQSRAAQLYG